MTYTASSTEVHLWDSEYFCYALTLRMPYGTLQRTMGRRTLFTVTQLPGRKLKLHTVWWSTPRMKGRWD